MTLSRKMLALAAGLGLAGAGTIGCKPDRPPRVEPDANSGPDGSRSGAILITTVHSTDAAAAGAVDKVDYDKGDQTDWKKVDLKGNPGILTIELHWDNAQADLNVDVYNSNGEQIAASPPASPGAQSKRVVADIPAAATYFIRIQAAKTGDHSDYTVKAIWDGDAAPPPPPPAPPPPPPPPEPTPPPVVEKHHHHGPSEPHVRKARPDAGVQGRIVSSYKDGGGMTLHIDKGSQAGVKVGDIGTILEGPSGADALDGGTFNVVQVIDENHCVAKTNLKSIGRNTRVAINTK